jgi:hypothetical protein
MNREERGPWYLITALIIGVGAGLFYAWFLAPVAYVDIAPVSLQENYKDQYRALIAAAYAANNDLGRARSRLDQLEDPDTIRTITMQAQRALLVPGQENVSQFLGMLALALEQDVPVSKPVEAEKPDEDNSPLPVEEPAEEPESSPAETIVPITPTEQAAETPATFNISNTSPTQTASTGIPESNQITITPLPTRTPTSTIGASFVLRKEAALLCNLRQPHPLLIIETYDASDKPIPGLQIIVKWSGGEDSFFTGLKTEKGLGYADFIMTPGISYTVQVADGGQLVQGLAASECKITGSTDTYWGSWKIIYEQR